MRRIIGVGVTLVFAALAVFLWKQSQISVASNQIAPDNSVFYIEIPHLVQTERNLPDTALYQIFQEPSVQRFLKQPRSDLWKEYQSSWDSFLKLGCTALFFCATDPSHQRWMAGFQTPANATVRTREIENISKRLFGCGALHVSPAQPDRVSFADDATGIFFTEIGGWTVISTNRDLLKVAFKNTSSGAGGLFSSKLFQECRSSIRPAYDMLLFARGSPSLNVASGVAWEFDHEQTPGSPQAVMASTTIEGARLRDTIFTCTSPRENYGPLSRQGLAMTSPKTIGYMASRLEISELWRLSDRFSGDWPVAAALRDYIGETRSAGIEPQDLDRLVTSAEIVVDQVPDSESLATAVLLEVTDETKFQQLMDRIVQEKLPDSCRSTSIEGMPAYILSPNENVSVVFGLVKRKLLIAWDESVFAVMVRRLRVSDEGLERDRQFKETEALVAAPSDLFLYIDAKAGFQRFYDAVRPMLIFGTAMIPPLNRFVDAMAFPETTEIARHLSPIVLSRHRVSKGFVDESVGPLTAYEVSAFAVGSAMAVGLLQRQ
jgi:hypothetical protein